MLFRRFSKWCAVGAMMSLMGLVLALGQGAPIHAEASDPEQGLSSGVDERVLLLKSQIQVAKDAVLLVPSSSFFAGLQPSNTPMIRYLDLSDTQIENLAKLDAMTRAAIKASYEEDISLLEANGKNSRFSEIVRWYNTRETRRAQIVKAAEEASRQVILTEKQAEKLRRNEWRLQGANALLDDGLAAELKLTSRQRETLARLKQEQDSLAKEVQVQELATQKESPERAAVTKEGINRRQLISEAMTSVLTPEQAKKYRTLMVPLPSARK